MTQPTTDPKLAASIEFILEMDRLKSIYRQSPLLDGSRRENSAEHSWHMAVMALILGDYADTPVNVARVIELLLLHDVVEIDAGDVFLYDDQAGDQQHRKELQAADRLFGMLPAPLDVKLRNAWLEFETGHTPEAKFARALDRFQPLLLNFHSGGGTWKQPQVTHARVLAKKAVIGHGSTLLWSHARALLDQAVERGILRTSAPEAQAGTPASPRYRRLPAAQADPALRDTLQSMESAYGIALPTLIAFDHDALQALHGRAPGTGRHASQVEVASWGDARIAPQIRRLGELARLPAPSAGDRLAYKEILLGIYRALPTDMEEWVADPGTLVVAPRREGYLLAQALGWLPPGRFLAPHAKRFKHGGGMVVGFDLVPPATRYRRCVLVDGAMASGVSLMAMMIELAPQVDQFIVLTVHATGMAINALRQLASQLQRPLLIHAGDVGGELNDKFYAVVPGSSPPVLLVGDLGDMIAGPAPALA